MPHKWSIGVSENGWTTNEIGLTWLHLFHGSHVNPEFDQFCLEHHIIVPCMPVRSSICCSHLM
jgi:hypothetical protein